MESEAYHSATPKAEIAEMGCNNQGRWKVKNDVNIEKENRKANIEKQKR